MRINRRYGAETALTDSSAVQSNLVPGCTSGHNCEVVPCIDNSVVLVDRTRVKLRVSCIFLHVRNEQHERIGRFSRRRWSHYFQTRIELNNLFIVRPV